MTRRELDRELTLVLGDLRAAERRGELHECNAVLARLDELLADFAAGVRERVVSRARRRLTLVGGGRA